MGDFKTFMENTVRTGQPGEIMYHAAPTKVRQSILNHGIDYRVHFQNIPQDQNTPTITYAPRGNYLDENLASAKSYASESSPVPWDIWEVQVQGLLLRPDEAWFKGWYTKKRIPANQIRLVIDGNHATPK